MFAFLAYRKISHESRRSSKSGVTISPLIFAIEQRPRTYLSSPRNFVLIFQAISPIPPTLLTRSKGICFRSSARNVSRLIAELLIRPWTEEGRGTGRKEELSLSLQARFRLQKLPASSFCGKLEISTWINDLSLSLSLSLSLNLCLCYREPGIFQLRCHAN